MNRLSLRLICSYNVFVGTATKLVILPLHIPSQGKEVVYCCLVTLWSVLVASIFFDLNGRGENRSPTVADGNHFEISFEAFDIEI